jgi:hypothetical protein
MVSRLPSISFFILIPTIDDFDNKQLSALEEEAVDFDKNDSKERKNKREWRLKKAGSAVFKSTTTREILNRVY